MTTAEVIIVPVARASTLHPARDRHRVARSARIWHDVIGRSGTISHSPPVTAQTIQHP